MRAAAGKFSGNLTVLSIFLGIGFAYIQKKRLLFLLWRRGAVGGKRKCIVFEETKAPKGENTFIFRVQRYCFYLICANFLAEKFIFNAFFLHISEKSSNFAATLDGGYNNYYVK